MELLDGHSKDFDYSFKIMLLGKSSIGKTIFISRFKTINYFEFKKNITSDYQETVGFNFPIMDVKVNNKIIRLQIWDCCGNELYSSLIKWFYKNSKAFLIFYDFNDRNSFERVKLYFNDIDSTMNTQSEFFLIRIKYELKYKEKNDFVSDEEALEYVHEKNAYFCHISIFEKYETGIYELIKLLIEKLIDKHNKNL